MVVIRLMRCGSKKRPAYRIVVQEKSKRKEGRTIDLLGHYNPAAQPKIIKLDRERAQQWLQKGAQASPTVKRLLKATGGEE